MVADAIFYELILRELTGAGLTKAEDIDYCVFSFEELHEILEWKKPKRVLGLKTKVTSE